MWRRMRLETRADGVASFVAAAVRRHGRGFGALIFVSESAESLRHWLRRLSSGVSFGTRANDVVAAPARLLFNRLSFGRLRLRVTMTGGRCGVRFGFDGGGHAAQHPAHPDARQRLHRKKQNDETLRRQHNARD